MHSLLYRIRNHTFTEYAYREFGKFLKVELLYSAGLLDYLEVTLLDKLRGWNSDKALVGIEHIKTTALVEQHCYLRYMFVIWRTRFYLTTHITIEPWRFRVKGGIAALTAIPICCEAELTEFSLMQCS